MEACLGDTADRWRRPPLLVKAKTSEESETPRPAPRPTGPIGFRGGRLWTFTAKTLPMRVGGFLSQGRKPAEERRRAGLCAWSSWAVPTRAEKKCREDLITKPPFELGKIVDTSQSRARPRRAIPGLGPTCRRTG